MKNKYFSLIKNEENNSADINIFGDITSWDWEELGEMSAHTLSKQLEEIGDVDTINVHISSYGGEVKEGLAIYNALKNHKAKIKTYCDGFACSIASVIFMAGDERIMSKSSALMIHNAWTFVSGNANDLRKEADDLEKITKLSIEAYMEHINVSEKELKNMLDNETWLLYDECLEMGFATSVTGENKDDNPSQSAKHSVLQMIKKYKSEKKDEEVTIVTTSIDETVVSNVENENINDKENEDNATERVVAFFSALENAMKGEK